LRLRYDWRGQRFSRFPDAHTDSNGHRNRHSYAYGHGYSDSHSNGYRDGNADARTQWQIFADTETTSDTSASPVGPCISSDRRFADEAVGIAFISAFGTHIAAPGSPIPGTDERPRRLK
jgi:hypothetical protein